MTRGTRGGSNDAALPNISTSDDISAGDYAGTKMQVVIMAIGPDTDPTPISDTTALPVELLGTDVNDVNSSSGTSPFTLTLPAVAGKTNYVTGFEVTGQGATAGKFDAAQLIGIHANTVYYNFEIPAGLDKAVVLIVEFTRPIPATAPNTAIQLAVPAFGAGNTLFTGHLHGFYR